MREGNTSFIYSTILTENSHHAFIKSLTLVLVLADLQCCNLHLLLLQNRQEFRDRQWLRYNNFLWQTNLIIFKYLINILLISNQNYNLKCYKILRKIVIYKILSNLLIKGTILENDRSLWWLILNVSLNGQWDAQIFVLLPDYFSWSIGLSLPSDSN